MKLFIAVPAFGHQINSQTAVSLVALTQQLTLAGIPTSISALSFPDLVDLRNVFLSTFYDGLDATHMLFVDADMQFEPNLVQDMLNADKPLVGCLYRTKRLPGAWVGSALTPAPDPENGLLELEGIGCGVMLIRRDCVSNMIETGYAEVQTDLRGTAMKGLLDPHGVKRIIRGFDKVVTEDGRHLSEDYSFCHRHRKAGGKVYAAINHSVTHLGVMPFVGRYSDIYKVQEAAE